MKENLKRPFLLRPPQTENVNLSCSCRCFTPGEKPRASFRPFGLIKSHKRCGSRTTTRAVSGLWYFMSILCSMSNSQQKTTDLDEETNEQIRSWSSSGSTSSVFSICEASGLNLAAKSQSREGSERLWERESGRVIKWLQFESFRRQIKL